MRLEGTCRGGPLDGQRYVSESPRFKVFDMGEAPKITRETLTEIECSPPTEHEYVWDALTRWPFWRYVEPHHLAHPLKTR